MNKRRGGGMNKKKAADIEAEEEAKYAALEESIEDLSPEALEAKRLAALEKLKGARYRSVAVCTKTKTNKKVEDDEEEGLARLEGVNYQKGGMNKAGDRLQKNHGTGNRQSFVKSFLKP